MRKQAEEMLNNYALIKEAMGSMSTVRPPSIPKPTALVPKPQAPSIPGTKSTAPTGSRGLQNAETSYFATGNPGEMGRHVGQQASSQITASNPSK